MTSCSRIPVIRKNSNQSRSSSVQAWKSMASSSDSYISSFSSVERGQFVLSHETTNPVCLEKRHPSLELVVDGAGRLLLLITEKANEFEHIVSLDLMQVELAAGLSEVVKSGRVRSQCLWLL